MTSPEVSAAPLRLAVDSRCGELPQHTRISWSCGMVCGPHRRCDTHQGISYSIRLYSTETLWINLNRPTSSEYRRGSFWPTLAELMNLHRPASSKYRQASSKYRPGSFWPMLAELKIMLITPGRYTAATQIFWVIT